MRSYVNQGERVAATVLRATAGLVFNRRLITEVLSITTAISGMHAAAGDAQRAAELERDAVARLTSISPTPERESQHAGFALKHARDSATGYPGSQPEEDRGRG